MDSMRYDHAMMADHVSAQAQLATHMNDLRQQAMNAVQHAATIWTQHGSDAAQVASTRSTRHSRRCSTPLTGTVRPSDMPPRNALTTDHGVQAGFRGL